MEKFYGYIYLLKTQNCKVVQYVKEGFLMLKVKKILFSLSVFALAVVPAYAQSTITPVDIGIAPADAVTSVATVLGLAIAAALGLAVTVYAVIAGWRKIKMLAKG